MVSHSYSKDLIKKHFSLTKDENTMFDTLKIHICAEQKMTSIPRQVNINSFRFMLQLATDYFAGKVKYID